MPLYTVRANLAMEGGQGRGSGYAVMHHHFDALSDGAMVTALPFLVDAWISSGISSRWVVVRGSAAHELVLYRRSIENRNIWTRLSSVDFALPEWAETSQSIEIGSAAIDVTGREEPIYRHRKGAVLVVQTGENASIKKRTYVGPISPVCFVARPSFGLGIPGLFMAPSLIGDFPLDEGDSVDIWRDSILELARDHVHNLDVDVAGGHSVLVSWKNATMTRIATTAAMPNRAELRNRGLRRAPWGAIGTGL